MAISFQALWPTMGLDQSLRRRAMVGPKPSTISVANAHYMDSLASTRQAKYIAIASIIFETRFMMSRGRPRAFDRDKALADAMEIFWRKSFNATSVRNLSEALGIGMPSLYATFGSKEDLFVEAAALYMKAAHELWRTMDGLSPRAAVETVLRNVARELSDGEAHPTGCMIMGAFVDEDMPAPVAETIRQGRRDWSEVFRDQLTRAIEQGELSAEADVDSLTRFFAGIVQSIGVQAHDGAHLPELTGIIDVAMAAWPANDDRPKEASLTAS